MATNSSSQSQASAYVVEPLDGFSGAAYVGHCAGCGHRTKRKGSERIAEAAIRDHVKACAELATAA